MAAFSGLRLGELKALRWRHVDFKSRLIHVERSLVRGSERLPKSGKVRAVPLADQTATALKRMQDREHFTAPNDLVFLSPTRLPVDSSKTRKEFLKAAKAAGVKVLRFHDLRHTCGTLLIRALPLSDVQRILGHADIATTQIYLHSKPMDSQTDALNDLLSDALKPRLVDSDEAEAA